MDSKSKWNSKYQDRINWSEVTVANRRLQALSPYLKGGSAFDFACGLGGNSLFLAQQNYEVHALDISNVAIGYLTEQARKKQLPIQTRICDLSDMGKLPVEENLVDLVVITYYLDRNLFPIVKSLIKRRGYFFMETFYLSDTHESNHVSDKYKLRPQELLQEFAGWKVHFYEENEQEGRQTIFCQKK